MKTNRILPLLLLFMILSSVLKSQDQPKIDSLFQVLRTSKQDTNKVLLLYELSREFFNNDITASETYANSALSLSEKLGYKKDTTLSYSN